MADTWISRFLHQCPADFWQHDSKELDKVRCALKKLREDLLEADVKITDEDVTKVTERLFALFLRHITAMCDKNKDLPDSDTLFMSDGAGVLRSLVKLTGGKPLVLDAMRSHLEDNQESYLSPNLPRISHMLIQFMSSCHMDESKRSLLDGNINFYDSVSKLVRFILLACGFKDNIECSINNLNIWHINLITPDISDFIDEHLLHLLKPFLKDADTEKLSKHIHKDHSKNSIIHYTACLMLPSTTEALLPHFDVNGTGERGYNHLELMMESLRLHHLNPQNIIKMADCILSQNGFRVGRNTPELMATLSIEFNRYYSISGICKKLEALLSILPKLARHASASEEVVAQVVFGLIRLFPMAQHYQIVDMYEKTLEEILSSGHFDINKLYKPVQEHSRTLTEPAATLAMFVAKTQDAAFQWFPYNTLTSVSDFNPNVVNESGESALHLLVHEMWIAQPVSYNNKYSLPPEVVMKIKMLEQLLQHEKTDVKIADKKRQVASYLAIRHDDQKPPYPSIVLVKLLELLCGHMSTNEELIYQALKKLANMHPTKQGLRLSPAADAHQEDDRLSLRSKNVLDGPGEEYFRKQYEDIYTDAITALCKNKHFDINCQGSREEKYTVAHMAAICGNRKLFEALIRTDTFQPNVQDELGNTPFHYAVEKFRNVIEAILEPLKIKKNLDFSKKNKQGESLSGLLCKGKTLAANESMEIDDTTDSEEEGEEKPKVILKPAKVPQNSSILIPEAADAMTCDCRPSTVKDSGYDMSGEPKGQVCIISTPEVQGMDPLPGYDHDVQRLVLLWTRMGFSVCRPYVKERKTYLLNRMEICHAVERFAEQLDEDQCAVLCLLGHGGQGFLFDKDRKKVYINKLMRKLDNERCLEMSDKPKVVIVQACSGNKEDPGVSIAHAGDNDTNGSKYGKIKESFRLVPTASDFIVAYASSPGYTACVRNADPGERGSFFIHNLVDVFAKYAAHDEIHTLLRKVNKAVADELITMSAERDDDGNVTKPGRDLKQMPQFTSTMRESLYLMPPSTVSEQAEN